MSESEARRPSQAGQSHPDAINDDPETQAALRRARVRLQVFGAAGRAVVTPAKAAIDAATPGDFGPLRELVAADPDLKEAVDDLEQAVLAMKGADDPRPDIAKRLESIRAAVADNVRRSLGPLAFGDRRLGPTSNPIGTQQIKDAVREGLRGQAEKGAPASVGRKRRRAKREIAEQQIMAHLIRRPHDTVEEVARVIQCSAGVVAESPAWKANQRRLKAATELARKTGRAADPSALPLEDYLSPAGDNPGSQLRAHREEEDAMDDAIDQREQELNRQIAEYLQKHPNATPQEVAKGVGLGCTAGEVERRQAELDKLEQEQVASAAEDGATIEAQQRPKRRPKQV